MKAKDFLDSKAWETLHTKRACASLGLAGDKLDQLKAALLAVVTAIGDHTSILQMVWLHAENKLEFQHAFPPVDKCDSVGELAQVHAMMISELILAQHIEDSDKPEELLQIFVHIRDKHLEQGHSLEGLYHAVANQAIEHLQGLIEELNRLTLA